MKKLFILLILFSCNPKKDRSEHIAVLAFDNGYMQAILDLDNINKLTVYELEVMDSMREFRVNEQRKLFNR